RLGLAADKWLTLTTEFEKQFCYAAGPEQMMLIWSCLPIQKKPLHQISLKQAVINNN
ncbi:MAG: hypothetical protein ACI9J5_002998, partial [Paraglaciecola sp.]